MLRLFPHDFKERVRPEKNIPLRISAAVQSSPEEPEKWHEKKIDQVNKKGAHSK